MLLRWGATGIGTIPPPPPLPGTTQSKRGGTLTDTHIRGHVVPLALRSSGHGRGLAHRGPCSSLRRGIPRDAFCIVFGQRSKLQKADSDRAAERPQAELYVCLAPMPRCPAHVVVGVVQGLVEGVGAGKC